MWGEKMAIRIGLLSLRKGILIPVPAPKIINVFQ